MEKVYTLEDIREAVFASWSEKKAQDFSENRLQSELEKVARVEAWSSVCVLCGRLAELLLTGYEKLNESGKNFRPKSTPLARRIEEIPKLRNENHSLMSHAHVAAQSIRTLRNISAHSTFDREITENEATLAIASYAILREALSPTPLPEISWPRSARGVADPCILKDAWRQFSPNTLCRWLVREDASSCKAVVENQGVDFFRHLIGGSTMNSLSRLPQRLCEVDCMNDQFAEALILEVGHVLKVVGQSRGSLLKRFVTYLGHPSLREIKFILLALLPYDNDWLTEQMIRGVSLTAICWSLGSMKRSKHVGWKGLESDADKIARITQVLWARWDGTVQNAKRSFLLAKMCPDKLQAQILQSAPDEAILMYMCHPSDFFDKTRMYYYFLHNVTRSSAFMNLLKSSYYEAILHANIAQKCHILSSLGAMGEYREEGLDCALGIIDSSATILGSDARNIVLTLYLSCPSLGAQTAANLLESSDGVELTWNHLVLAGITSTADEARVSYETLWSPSSMSLPHTFHLPGNETQLDCALVIHFLRSFFAHSEIEALLLNRLQELPSTVVRSVFGGWVASKIEKMGLPPIDYNPFRYESSRLSM